MNSRFGKKISLILVGLCLLVGVVAEASAYTVIRNGVIYECNQWNQCKVVGTVNLPIDPNR